MVEKFIRSLRENTEGKIIELDSQLLAECFKAMGYDSIGIKHFGYFSGTTIFDDAIKIMEEEESK